jgi:hypothetical protein
LVPFPVTKKGRRAVAQQPSRTRQKESQEQQTHNHSSTVSEDFSIAGGPQ